MTIARTALAFAAMMAAPTALVHAGAVFEIETTYYRGDTAEKETIVMAAEGRNMKMDMAEGVGNAGPDQIIFHGERREMIAVDHDEQSFTVMDEDQIKAMRQSMGVAGGADAGGAAPGLDAMIQEALKNVPEEQRAMVEKMMREQMQAQMPEATDGAAAGNKTEYRKTGERETVADVPSVKYEGIKNGQLVTELWIADWGDVEGGDEARDAFRAMTAFWNDSFGDLPQMQEDNPFEVFESVDGFPVRTRDYHQGEIESESILRSASERDLDAAEFEAPAGYQRTEMMP